MAVDREELKRLARQLAELTTERKPAQLRVVKVPERGPILFSDVEREWIRSQILTLQRIYCLEWFVRQEMYGRYGFEELSDDDLLALLRSVERAVCCIRDGVSFEDAGLIRTEPDNFGD